MELRPITYEAAAEYVDEHHRHHKRPTGHKFSVACYDGDRLCGVVMVGRPVSRHLDDGETLEINRVCTDGTRNACSMLYGAAWRAAQAMGYKRVVTYTLESEPGTSLRAAGFRCDGAAGGLTWDGCERTKERKRAVQMSMFPEKEVPQEMKVRWSKENERNKLE